jgi:hypothetical protein
MIAQFKQFLSRFVFRHRFSLPDKEKCKQETPQEVDESNWFEAQMNAIHVGKRIHPAMMNAMERHLETAKVIKNMHWNQGEMDPHGVIAGFNAIRDAMRIRGSATGFLFVLTSEEREELHQIVREEIEQELMKHQSDQERQNASAIEYKNRVLA